MSTTITFNDQEKVNISFDWPPPPEKDEIKKLGAKWDPTDKVWVADISYEMAEWLKGHGIEIPDNIAIPDPPIPEIPEGQSLEEILAESFATDSDIEIPAPEGMTYRAFQRAGIAWALKRPGALIGDDMGLGKTIQALGVINADPEIRSALIVCPLSVALNWRKEAASWLTREMSVGVATGKNFPDTDIVIVHWAIVANHQEAIRKREWGLVALDEAHYAKNPKAKRTQAIIGHGKDLKPLEARRKLSLTGTPIPNRPIEAYPVLRWLAPRQFDNWFEYATKYCNGFSTPYGWDVSGASNIDELNERLRLIMIRRLKKDVLTELPPKTRQVILLDPNTPELRAVLHTEDMVVKKTEEAIMKARVDVELAKAEGPEEYEKAVRALRDTQDLAFNELSRVRHETALAKLPQVLDHARDILNNEGQKLIIFAHHRDVINKLREGLEDGDDDTPGIKTVSIMGGDKPEDRQSAIEAFQNDPSARVFLGSIMAAKEGITLTAADISIFAELDWVPGNLSQAEDRNYRIGQRNSVLIQHLVVDGSIDARMADTILAKQAMLDKVLDARHDEVVSELPEELSPAGNPDSELTFMLGEDGITWITNDPEAEEGTAATANTRASEVERLAEWVTNEDTEAVHEGLRLLAGMDWDHAQERNDMGFNRYDVRLGHELAERGTLSPKQAVLGAKLTNKYRRQLPERCSRVWKDLKQRLQEADAAPALEITPEQVEEEEEEDYGYGFGF